MNAIDVLGLFELGLMPIFAVLSFVWMKQTKKIELALKKPDHDESEYNQLAAATTGRNMLWGAVYGLCMAVLCLAAGNQSEAVTVIAMLFVAFKCLVQAIVFAFNSGSYFVVGSDNDQFGWAEVSLAFGYALEACGFLLSVEWLIGMIK